MGRILVEEREFEVPYGILKAKAWHEEADDCFKILAIHGWMDNAGSFDRLVPLLSHPRGLYIVGLDLPGHGRSSQLPKGAAYSDASFLVEIRRVVKQLGWKKFSLLGHSLGGGLAMWYASLYPDEIEQVILIDFIKPRTTNAEELCRRSSDAIDTFIDITQNSRDKGYVTVSREVALITTIEAHKSFGKLTRDDASCLLKRSTVDVSSPPNNVIYYRDTRLQSLINFREHFDLSRLMFSGVRCQVISILGRQGFYKSEKDEDYWNYLDEFISVIASKCSKLSIHWLDDGDHYLHMTYAKELAEKINKFMQSPESNFTPLPQENISKCSMDYKIRHGGQTTKLQQSNSDTCNNENPKSPLKT